MVFVFLLEQHQLTTWVQVSVWFPLTVCLKHPYCLCDFLWLCLFNFKAPYCLFDFLWLSLFTAPYCLCDFLWLCLRWLRGLGNGHWPQVWDLPKNPTTWTLQDRVPYAPNIHRLPHVKKYIKVKFPMNCRVARWPRGLGDGHWPQVLDLPKNPTTWTTRDRVPYAPNIHRLPHIKKYI